MFQTRIFLLLILCTINFKVFGKYFKGTIYYKNGTEQEGFIDNRVTHAASTIYFKPLIEGQKGKKQKVDSDDLIKVVVHYSEDNIWEYHRIPHNVSFGKSIYIGWLVLIEEGPVRLYGGTVYQWSNMPGDYYHFCIRPGEEYATWIKRGGGPNCKAKLYIDFASNYFSDEESIVKKIKDGVFSCSETHKLVQEYNKLKSN